MANRSVTGQIIVIRNTSAHAHGTVWLRVYVRCPVQVEAECGDIACALVQNKVDLVDQAVVRPEEVEGIARKLGLKLYRSCVKENINVTEVFVYLAGRT